jgi:4-hydroxybenzoate adenylyltransferase
MNLAATMETLAAEGGWLDTDAYLVDDHHFTYAEVYSGASAAAAFLKSSGVRRGDRVLLALPDGFDLVRTLLGIARIGAVAVLVNPMLPAEDLGGMHERADPVAVICAPALASTFDGARIIAPHDIPVSGGGQDPAPVDPGEPLWALFTSGTTGDPKLCFHTHRDALAYDQAFGKPVLGIGPGDITLSVSKASFAYGFGNSLLYPLLNGATAVLVPGQPTPEVVLDAIERHGVRVLFAVPSFYGRLLAHPSKELLRKVDKAVCAGEVLPRPVEDAVAALDGPVLLNGIGSTEVGQTFAANAIDAHRPGTVGKVLPPYRIRVVDEAGVDVPAGTEGALLVSGPTVTTGCATAADYRPPQTDEWHPTGDAATIDGDGFLTIAGRVDDLEIVAGVNVHPAAIEQLFLSQAQVRDAAVCAIPDGDGVSRLVAYVVLADGEIDDGQLRSRLVAHLRGKLAPHKIPRTVVFVPELPRTYTGKLRRRALRSAAAAFETTGTWRNR